jgi:hypothetical protein
MYDLISTRSDLVLTNMNGNLWFSPVKLDTHPTLAIPVLKNCQKLGDYYHHMSEAIQKIVFSYHIQAGGE